jgi:hypothetical protein
LLQPHGVTLRDRYSPPLEELLKERLVIHADSHPAGRWKIVSFLGVAQLISRSAAVR